MISKKNFAKVSATLGAVALGVSATATAANADTIYTVQSGDTLSGISYKFAKDNSMVNDLAKKNNIQDINKIYVGQKLIIKSDGEIQEYNAQNAANANVANNNTQATQQQAAQAQSQASQSYTSNASGSEAAAKAWIAQHESSNNYNALATYMVTFHLRTKNVLLTNTLRVVTVHGKMLRLTGKLTAGTKI